MKTQNRPNSKLTLIAEIGINHNGDMDICKKLIDIAKRCDCDYVKFQKRKLDIVYTQDYLAAERESPWGATQREQKEGLEFEQEQFQEVDRYCKEVGIGWFASAWDAESLKFLDPFNCDHQKIASAMLTNTDFLKFVAERKVHTYISTGMAQWKDIDQAVEIFKTANCPMTLMHCVSTYPTPLEKCNVSLIQTLKERYGVPVGYSGHEAGTLPTMLAAAMGVDAIERHITLDRAMYGSDQAASLEERGLSTISKFIRNLEAAYGDGEKTFDDDEKKIAQKLRYFESL